MFDIFQECKYSSSTNYSEVVQEISQIVIEADDALSKNICSTCKDSCDEILRFREQIVSSIEYQQMILKNGVKSEEMTVLIETIEEHEIQLDEDEDKQIEVQPFEISIHEIVAGSDNDLDTEEDFFYDGDDLITSAASSEVSDDEEDVTENDEKEYECPKCSKSFSKESKLKKHLKSHSTKARMIPCKTCKRKFTTEILLARHEIVHSDLITQIKFENTHRCIICNETFAGKTNYEDHIRDHKIQMKERTTLSCLYCEKDYSKLSNLIRHLKTHEENKTHACNVCQKTFAMGQDLIDHLNKHRGFTPHSCHICGKSYLQVSKLNNHLKTHSEDKVSCCCYSKFT